MDSKQLRIGNHVMYTDQFGKYVDQIRVLNEEYCQLDNHGARFDYSGLEPVPLTEDWLMKFGATKRIVSEWDYHLKVGAVKIYFRKNISWYSELEGIYLGSHIQYVHQLENLYFALTGNELVPSAAGKI